MSNAEDKSRSMRTEIGSFDLAAWRLAVTFSRAALVEWWG